MTEGTRASTDERALKVLHLLGTNADEGGILAVIRNLQSAPSLAQVKHQVLVNEAYTELRKPALQYVRSKHLLAESPKHSELAYRAWKAWFEVKELLQREAIDVVHLHSRGALFTALLLSWFQNRLILHTNHTYARRIGLYQYSARQPRFRTVTLTPRMAQHYQLEPQPGNIEVISACFADDFLNHPLPARIATTDRPLNLVGVGSIVRWKNWSILLEAIALLPKDVREKVAFHHWGPITPDADSKAYEGELYARTESLRLRQQVTWHGPTTEVISKLQDADLFVLPSNHEPCSVALMEGLALGIPALVSNSGGNPDILQDGETGLLFEMNNPLSLAGRLESVIRRQVIFQGPDVIRDSVRKRSATEVGKEYARIYREIADQQKRISG